MTATTVTLNPGSGGAESAHDSLTTLDGAAAPASAVAQLIKLIFGDASDARMVSATHGLPVSQTSPFFWRVGFAEVGSGLQGLAAAELSLLKTGAGMTVNQSGGNLVVTTGTTTNAETVFRSVDTFRGALLARYQIILSQRTANQTFRVELADLIGEGLAYTINSATSVTVTFPTTNPFTAANVGQSLRLAVLSSVGVPGRYAIDSVSGLTVTFTVASWPGSGSGTLTLYGHNWLAAEYSGTTAANAFIDAQRSGWANGNTTASINTTASPGHIGQIAYDVMSMSYADSRAISNTGYQWEQRASRITNVPDEDVSLYLFLVIQNGNTPPASTTTVTVGFLSVEDQPRNKVRVSGSDPVGGGNATPVQVMGGNLGTQAVIFTQQALPAGTANIGYVGLQIPLPVADVASAALTTTTTTAALTPGFGASYSVNIPVTAVSGTTPTLDVVVEESDDTGTSWTPVYAFPRITATGNYRSPALPNFGNRVRYVQTVTGTTPSFTRAVNRLQRSDSVEPLRQIIDRTVALNTLNSNTPTLNTQGTRNVQIVLNVGAITTTAPALQLEASDDNGASWYAVGSPLTAVASSTVQLLVNNVQAAALRARVSTAGSGATAGYLLLKAF